MFLALVDGSPDVLALSKTRGEDQAGAGRGLFDFPGGKYQMKDIYF